MMPKPKPTGPRIEMYQHEDGTHWQAVLHYNGVQVPCRGDTRQTALDTAHDFWKNHTAAGKASQ